MFERPPCLLNKAKNSSNRSHITTSCLWQLTDTHVHMHTHAQTYKAKMYFLFGFPNIAVQTVSLGGIL